MGIRKSATRRSRKASEEYRLPELVEISHEEAWARFDIRARELLGISGEEFIERLERGDYYSDGAEDPRVTDLYFLMIHPPTAR